MLRSEDIDRRLDILLGTAAAAAAGERTSRAELLAALVAAAGIDPEQMAALPCLPAGRPRPTATASRDTARFIPTGEVPGGWRISPRPEEMIKCRSLLEGASAGATTSRSGTE